MSIALAAFVLIAGIAAVDFATKYVTAVSLLYLVPLYLVAWFSWRPAATLLALCAGLSDSLLTSIGHQECPAVNVLNSAIQSIFFMVFIYILAELKSAQARLDCYSKTDPLTQLYNGRHFFELGAAEALRSARYKRPFSTIYMDMDDFKRVNDTLGHGIGDTFLREIAERIKNSLRKTDAVARLGGDEFAVLMPETDAEAAKVAIGRIQQSLTVVRMPSGQQATFSMGVVTNLGQDMSFDDMIKTADALMYEAKHAGKNAFRATTLTPP